jgi:hypothetical protein
LNWVWREVRKRVFIKLPFSLGVADAMEAAVPIVLDEDTFVCGLAQRDFPLSGHLHADQVRNTIENILRQASRRHIRFEVIEGTSLSDWETIKERQRRAHAAVIAMAEQKIEEHHFDDVLNQIVSELRTRITSVRDRTLPQVRAELLLRIVPQLSDAEDMLFAEQESHDRRRAMARAIDRIALFLEVPPLTLALEVERQRLQNQAERSAIRAGAANAGDSSASASVENNSMNAVSEATANLPEPSRNASEIEPLIETQTVNAAPAIETASSLTAPATKAVV